MTLPFQPAPGVAKITLNMTQSDAEPAVMTFHASNGTTDPWTHSDLVALAQSYADWWHLGDGTHSVRGVVTADDCTLDSVEARDLTVDGSTIGTVTVGIAGLVGGGQFPNGITFSMTARSGLTGKSNRGRSFVACIARAAGSSTDFNALNSTVAANLVLAYNNQVTRIPSYGGVEPATPCILSRWHAKVRRVSAVSVPIATYGFHDLFLDYMRRRAPAHNRHG